MLALRRPLGIRELGLLRTGAWSPPSCITHLSVPETGTSDLLLTPGPTLHLGHTHMFSGHSLRLEGLWEAGEASTMGAFCRIEE